MPTILIKKSDTPGAVPSGSDLTNLAGGAEIAVNTADKRVFSMTSASAIIELGTNPGSLNTADASATVLRAGSATITDLIATSATITTLTATSASVTNLTATSLVLSNLSIASANVTTLTSASATITNLLATSLTVSSGSTLDGGVVVNEPGADVDFRVESDTDANALFLEGSNGFIGVGTNSALEGSDFQISTGSAASSGPIASIFNTVATPGSSAFTRLNMGFASGGANYVLTDTVLGRLQFLGQGNDDAYVGASIQAQVVSGGNVGRGSGHGVNLIFSTKPTTATGVSERLRLDSSGNLGLGVTPSAWSLSGASALQIKNAGLMGYSNNTYLTSNAYNSAGTWKYIASTSAALYEQNLGVHSWSYAGSGTAGNNITFTQAMTLDASGNLGVGTTSPTNLLHLAGSSATPSLRLASTSTGFYWDIGRENATTGDFVFNQASGGAATEKARITSGGDLLVGTTNAANNAGVGAKILNNGPIYSTLSTNSGQDTFTLYSTAAVGYRFYVLDTGNIYATNTSVNAISDQRYKENIRDLDVGLDAVMALKPRKFDWKKGKGADTKDARGFIAQEFEQVFPDLVSNWLDPAPEGEEPYKSVRQDLIPVLVKAIQEQQAMIKDLEAKVAALEAK